MSIRPIVIAGLAASAVLAACAPTARSGLPSVPAAFSEQDFAWSRLGGQAAIEGRVAYVHDGETYVCAASVGLTPDTPYTRNRFRALYGSTENAAVPASVVRARDVPDPNADYRDYTRSDRCENGRFRFSGLPDGAWFLIAPATAPGAEGPLVLMRHVETRGGRVTTVNF